MAVNRIIELLKPELDIDKNDPRFIWGEVDDLTSTPFGLRFSYTREYAFSPLMDEAGEGFNFDTTIAIRENLIRARVEQSYSKTAIETEDYSNMFFTSKLHVTGHELSHLFSFHSKLIRPYRETFWKDDSKYDICRFFRLLGNTMKSKKISFTHV